MKIICAVWSAPLLYAYWKVSCQYLYYERILNRQKYHINTYHERVLNLLASLCSWIGWFESHFVGTPEDRFLAARPIPWWQHAQKWFRSGSPKHLLINRRLIEKLSRNVRRLVGDHISCGKVVAMIAEVASTCKFHTNQPRRGPAAVASSVEPGALWTSNWASPIR